MKYHLALLILCLLSLSIQKEFKRSRRTVPWKKSGWWKSMKSQFLKYAKKSFKKKYSRKPEKIGDRIAANDEWITCGTVKKNKCLEFKIVPIPSGCAVLYENCNFSGWKLLVCDNVPWLSSHRIDKVSSIKVGKKTKATLYEDIDFGGRKLSAKKKIACLIKYAFNDIASSLKIRKTKK